MRLVTLCIICCGIAAGSALAQPATGAVISLEEALRAARDNLDVSVARHAVAAAQADVLAANHAPAPVLSAKAASIDLQNGVGPGHVLTRKRIDKAIGLDWTWERGDKRVLRTRAAELGAQAARDDLADIRAQQQLATQEAFWQLLAAQQRLAEMRAIGNGFGELTRIAERRVKAGDLAAQDALRTRIEAERAAIDVEAAELERQRAALALGQRVRPGTASAALPTLHAQGEWPALAIAAPPAASWEQLTSQRPEVRAARARLSAAQAALDGAMALRKTDVTLGASFDHYPGTSNRLLELRLQVPLQWGYSFQGEIGRAQAELDQARDALEQTLRGAATELQALSFDVANAADRALRYEQEILPRARQAGDAAQLAYDKGAMPLSDLLDARRILRTTLMDAITARADHARAVTAWQLRTTPNE